MSLAEDRIELDEIEIAETSAAIRKWQDFPASTIAHHGAQCCQLAREWLHSTDYSQLYQENALSGPRWLRLKYKWGPSVWPIHWCEAAAQKTLDCGALAAIAQDLFTARGVRCYPAQFIQRYTEHSARHWNRKWDDEDASAHWIKEDLIYHEGCAVVVQDNEIKLWDPTGGWWVNPKQFGGYGGLLALRIIAAATAATTTAADAPREFVWGAQRLSPNQWQLIEREGGGLALASAP